MSESTRFMRELCKRATSITIVFIICVLFLLIQFPYLFVAEPGTAIYTISVMNLVGLIVVTLGTGWIVRKCSRIDV